MPTLQSMVLFTTYAMFRNKDEARSTTMLNLINQIRAVEWGAWVCVRPERTCACVRVPLVPVQLFVARQEAFARVPRCTDARSSTTGQSSRSRPLAHLFAALLV